MRLEGLELSRRTLGVLARAGVTRLEELLARNERELRALPGVGDGAVREIAAALTRRGLVLAARGVDPRRVRR